MNSSPRRKTNRSSGAPAAKAAAADPAPHHGPLTREEIHRNLSAFAARWSDAAREQAEKQTFWNEFFGAFGLERRALAAFEEPVRSIQGTFGAIDLFWPGRLLVEHKSRGASLDAARSQAFDYLRRLQDEINAGRRAAGEMPRYILLSDFATFALFDLEAVAPADPHVPRRFPLAELPQHLGDLHFITGAVRAAEDKQTELSLKAVDLMADLRDRLDAARCPAHSLERFLVRVLFCAFADSTEIFPERGFHRLVEATPADGALVGARLNQLFDILDTETADRAAGDPLLDSFPYVNGGLFNERLPYPAFDRAMRTALLECAGFDWSEVSPGIFGSLFQSVMSDDERRAKGAHYTRETDILKVLRPVLLEPFERGLERARGDRGALRALLSRLAALRILDPACGCGNFLVVAYRGMRRIEMLLIRALRDAGEPEADLQVLLGSTGRLSVEQFGGIEIDEWPARIAETALWLTDHQMNRELGDELGRRISNLPLRRQPSIIVGNALRMDWTGVLRAGTCTHVIGNPPFIGSKKRNAAQKADIDALFPRTAGRGRRAGDDPIHGHVGSLDYVAGWWIKLADYVRHHDEFDRAAGVPPIRCAFVSTNSVCQGEQAGVLWPYLFRRGLRIHFAYRTFPWQSEARGGAHVHVVIVGVGTDAPERAHLVDLGPDGQPREVAPRADGDNLISPYLHFGSTYTVTNRDKPLCAVPEIGIGSQPLDDGNYLFTTEEKIDFLRQEPGAKKYFRRWFGAEEFINSVERWALYLGPIEPKDLNNLPLCKERRRRVKEFREASDRKNTKIMAATPTLFQCENMPVDTVMVIPQVSSERRPFMPIAFMESKTVMFGDKVRISTAASLFHFGVLTSTMHMAWMRRVGGRMKSDYSYSIKLVYNNFPWPGGRDLAGLKAKQRAGIEAAAQAVLDARAPHLAGGSTLGQLYDPDLTPAPLAKAHAALDRLIDRAYRTDPFADEDARLDHLFALHADYTAGGLALV